MARILVFNCLVILVCFVPVYGQDCDVAACTNIFQNLKQQPGSFSVRKFEEACSLFSTASTCVESKFRRCTATKLDRFTWELTKDTLQLTCNERRADYLEVAPCIDSQQNLAAVEQCNQQLTKRMRGGFSCSQVRAHLNCITGAVKSCGEKAVDIMYTATRNVLVSTLEYLGVDGCSLGTTSHPTTKRITTLSPTTTSTASLRPTTSRPTTTSSTTVSSRTTPPPTTLRRIPTTVATTDSHDDNCSNNAAATIWPHISALCCFASILLTLYR